MKQYLKIPKMRTASMRLLFSYLAIILAPTVAIIVIYITMQDALLNIQKEKAQNLSKEAAVTFNKELDQLTNIGKYISSDSKLKKYMDDRSEFLGTGHYYKVYELAKSYPDYALLNRFVKTICIFPAGDTYMIQIPQVIPNNERGMSTVAIVRNSETYETLMDKLYKLGPNNLVYDKSDEGQGSFLILQNFNYEGFGKEDGIVVIEIDKAQIKTLLHSTLGNDEGVAFLTDSDGDVLYAYAQHDRGEEPVPENGYWKDYVEEIGWSSGSVTINKVPTDYNQWSLITVIPRKELLSKIGPGKYVILLLCILSVLIGVAICLWYWNSRRPVIERYVKFTEKYPEKVTYQEKPTDIWKNFGGVLEHVEDLQTTVDKQYQWARDGIIRKIFYGSYDSEEEIKSEMETMGITFSVNLPCFLVKLVMRDSEKHEMLQSPEILEEALKEELTRCLPCCYWMINMEPFSYILVVPCGEDGLENRDLKRLFEKVNYALYSQFPINIYTGISDPADSPFAVSEEYEHVCRICEYAQYYKMRMPLILEDIPRHQHVVFPMELEMQLENTIKGGTEEQLCKLMEQVMDNYLKIPGSGPMGQNLELLRCIVLRCLDDKCGGEQSVRIMNQVQHVKTASDMERCIFDTWHYFADKKEQTDDQDEELKKKIEEKIERDFSRDDFSLVIVADWLGIPDKKLYRDFKKMFGVSFSSYLEIRRIRCAQEYLKEGRAVQDVAAAVGYSSDYSFRRAFKRVVGVAPSDYQKRF